jgi:membrane associated rhomboid family serine protease
MLYAHRKKRRRQKPPDPVLTWMACAICVVMSLGRWGLYLPGAEWDGEYWALLTSVFVHIEYWHIAGNLFWLFFLGGELEKAIGSLRWLAFFLTAAIISSAIQLGISGNRCIGASGVVYAIFGFMWAARNHFDGFKDAIIKPTIIYFVAWLFLCLASTFLNLRQFGNAAHFSGLFWGIIVADIFVVRRKATLSKIASAAMVAASVIPLFWCPWSVIWVGKQADNAYSKGDYAEAIKFYNRSLELGQDPVLVYANLAAAYWQIGDQSKYKEAVKKAEELREKPQEQSPESGIKDSR